MKTINWQKEELSAFCMEYALLLKAGMPVSECFSIFMEDENQKDKKELFFQLYEKTSLGMSLSAAMEETGAFPEYLLKMVMLGEETGYLESTFTALSQYYDERRRMTQLLKETIIFPLVLLAVMIVIVILLITKVLPIFQDVFAQLGGTLPPFSMALLHFGILLQKGKWIFLILAILLAGAAVYFGFTAKGKEKFLKYWNRRFHRSKIGILYSRANFISALSMAVSSGQDLDHSLALAESFCSNSGLENQIAACRQAIQEGTPFTKAVEDAQLLHPKYCRMLFIGIRTGEIDNTLSEISKRSTEEAANALSKAAALVEPAVVILLSIIIGVLLISVMLPLIGILSSFG